MTKQTSETIIYVIRETHPDQCIECIFSTEEMAKKYVKKYKRYTWSPYVVDDAEDIAELERVNR